MHNPGLRRHCIAGQTQLIENILDKFIIRLARIIRKEGVLFNTDIPCSAMALLSLAYWKAFNKTTVIITDSPQTVETIHHNIFAFSSSLFNKDDLLYFPALETLEGKVLTSDDDIVGNRLIVLQRFISKVSSKLSNSSTLLKSYGSQSKHSPMITTCIQALMQKLASPDIILHYTLNIFVGEEKTQEDIITFLDKVGYQFVYNVHKKGEASIRGGLIDIWPLTETLPLRLEFDGNKIESIRSFNSGSQRSIEKLTSVVISPRNEWTFMQKVIKSTTTLLSFLPDDAVFVWLNYDNIRDHASNYQKIIKKTKAERVTILLKRFLFAVNRKKGIRQFFIGNFSLDNNLKSDLTRKSEKNIRLLEIKPVQDVFNIHREILQPDIIEENRHNLLSDLCARIDKGQTVVMFFNTQGSLEHFQKYMEENNSNYYKKKFKCKSSFITNKVGMISEGFICEAMRMIIVSESDLYGCRKILNRNHYSTTGVSNPEKTTGPGIGDLASIEPGDLVVHIEYGIGRYIGINEIIFNGQQREVLTIEYADNTKLHVPIDHLHFLNSYVGISGRNVSLHRIGGKRWSKEKYSAEHSIFNLASSLLEIQAHRRLKKGYAFSSETPWLYEFESSFPYHETPDQHKVIELVKNDMESQKPMERLVCGDAGYGKTEVAMRAAFKAAMDGKQTAVLVPTTVLAQQHFQTFIERMSAYPVSIKMLSRFCNKSERSQIITDLAKGKIDIVIGTHALLQPGIRFKDLGLVIIDEEQRFGVKHKEKLKHLKQLVDFLAMTATPIPRTLYMSLTGARDMSLLQTPPGERVATETIVTKNTDKIIREAILREINRNGQVFYLHNRVMSIQHVKQRLERLVPEARIEVAHGQMPPSKLASIMLEFVAGEFEILLCTTIIENGMDIPRANTILIDRADRFGIADLYQLRGRVGRSHHKAYAYLLLPEHGIIDSDAKQRIKAVKKFSSPGAGLNLALRDLEIRGAGNLLGTEQSGHITAIGFALYCQLLKQTVLRLKGEKPMPIINVEISLDFIDLYSSATMSESSAIIPYDYIKDKHLRIEIYRKMAEASSLKDISILREELNDRFGSFPPEVDRLLKIAKLKILAFKNNISKVESKNEKIMLIRDNNYIKKGARFPRLTKTTSDKKLTEIINLISSFSKL